jgi:hypothetical protein
VTNLLVFEIEMFSEIFYKEAPRVTEYLILLDYGVYVTSLTAWTI